MFLKFFLQPHKLVRSRMEVLGLIVVGGIHALRNVNKICIILITLQVRLNLDIRDHHYGLLLGYTSKEDNTPQQCFIFSTISASKLCEMLTQDQFRSHSEQQMHISGDVGCVFPELQKCQFFYMVMEQNIQIKFYPMKNG